MKYKQVTSDEWADFCSSFRTYATEGREVADMPNDEVQK